MSTLETVEVKRYKALGAAIRVGILFGVVAGLLAIGSQAPVREFATLNCAYAQGTTGTLTDAIPEMPAPCDPLPPARPSQVRHAVPEASSVDFGSAQDDEFKDESPIQQTF